MRTPKVSALTMKPSGARRQKFFTTPMKTADMNAPAPTVRMMSLQTQARYSSDSSHGDFDLVSVAAS